MSRRSGGGVVNRACFVLTCGCCILADCFNSIPLIAGALTVPRDGRLIHAPGTRMISCTVGGLGRTSMVLRKLSRRGNEIATSTYEFLVTHVCLCGNSCSGMLRAIGLLRNGCRLCERNSAPCRSLFSNITRGDYRMVLDMIYSGEIKRVCASRNNGKVVLLGNVANRSPCQKIAPSNSLISTCPVTSKQLVRRTNSSCSPGGPCRNESPHFCRSVMCPAKRVGCLSMRANAIGRQLCSPRSPAAMPRRRCGCSRPSTAKCV